MTIEEIKRDIILHINRSAIITEYGLRNKVNRYKGKIFKAFPNIFTVLINGEQKSFTYAEILTKSVTIDYN